MATIINDKDKILQASAVRLNTSPSNFIYFSTPAPVFKVVDTVATPSSYTIQAKLQGQISGTVTWSVVSGTVSSTSGQSGNTWTLAYTNMTSDVLVIRATLNYLGGIYSSDLTVTKVFNGAAAVVLDLISDTDVVFAANDGTGYTLPVGNSARIYSGGIVITTGVTYSGTTTKNGLTLTVNASTGELVLTGSNWTSNQESFTVTATYNALSYNIIYTIAKSRTGAIGTVTRIAYQLVSQTAGTPTYTSSTVGSTTLPGVNWLATVPTATVGNVVWYIYGQYNPNTFTSQGIAANTTLWSAPIAASIFQDIRSDNWNGSNPPVAATVTSWGTAGYYIARTSGNMFANGFYARGVVKINGLTTNTAYSVTTAADINASGDSDYGVIGYSNKVGAGILGWTDRTSAGVGVQGVSSTVGSTGVVAANNAVGTALYVQGKMQITNNTLVTNLNADLLDGKHATDLVQVASGTTNAKYLYYLNNNTTPTNPTTRAAWIKMSTNDGGVFWVEGYI